MNIIFYWKKKYFEEEYPQEKKNPLREFKLYTNYPPKHIINPGETIWVITKHNYTYVLVGKFIVTRTMIKQKSKNGDYCIVSNRNNNIYYDLDDVNQKRFKLRIQKLYNWNNDEIGVYFRGKRHIRELNDSIQQQQQFEKFSRILKTL